MGEHISSKPHSAGRANPPSAKFLDTTGNTTLGIGICARCQFKFPLGELSDDPNIPNFKVCRADRDDFDPYRMPARSPDVVQLPFIRPDEALTPGPSVFRNPLTGALLFTNDIGGVIQFINEFGGELNFYNNQGP